MVTDRFERLGLLASAVSGRALRVEQAGPGATAWTDGGTLFLAADAGPRAQLEALTVQASLLAVGSLDPALLDGLGRRARTAARYLAVEGHRALVANETLLPPSLRSLADRRVAARADSSSAALALALGREPLPDPPAGFGAIRPRRMLAPVDTSDSGHQHTTPPRRGRGLADLDEDGADDEGGDVLHLFSSPIGGGGGLGRLLRRMLLGSARSPGGGPPGADAPTHTTRAGVRGGRPTSVSAGRAPEAFAALERRGAKYPEWDVHQRAYRPEWCTVQEIPIHPRSRAQPASPNVHGLRRPLARLGVGLLRSRRQAQGDDIDLDAAVEAQLERIAGSTPREAVYLDTLRRRRDLSVLVLLDVSGSAAEPGVTGVPVHEHQRATAAALTVALHDLGDRVALYAFHSQGRSAVHLAPVKRFDDRLDLAVLRRLDDLEPGGYTRLGAAIRHGASVVERQGGTPRRLLVVLSDGFAYDHGYERAYGEADARRALTEARRRGTGCLCLSVGATTDADALRRVFGAAAHAAVPRPEHLSGIVGPLFHSALRTAEVRRVPS